ncbi:hypothetical protein BT96DRAFT_660168 [Gymnopus androsaceus JB14]|uniref:Uncharacterized protein n=1 Tax=Gymnopus androsaceus JB14 TaxID=1447944 RepID=A0A6A4GFQ5_9AGAR|nr:hypothetical protein BT96DRAFT_660168 [Gymnopus androsaceus JB14]
MEAVPCLRAALTRVELNEQDFRRLYGNVEPNAHAFNSPAIGQAPKEAIRKWLQGLPEKMRQVRRLPPYFPDDDGRDSSYISSSDADSFSTSSSDRESFDSSSSGGSRSDNSGYAGDHEGAGGTRVFIDLTGLDDEGVNLEDGRDFNDLAREDSVMDTGEGVIGLTQDDDEGEDENMDSPGPIILSDLGLDD